MKKIMALLLSIIMIFSVSAATSINVSAATNPYSYSGAPTRVLKYKNPTMKGDDVKWLQAALNCYGIATDIDGSFGPATKESVQSFQRSQGLSVDGSFGPASRKAMINWLASHGYSQNSGSSSNNAPAASTLSISEAKYPSDTLTKGKSFGIRGIISSNYTITNVTAQIKSGNTVVQVKSVNPNSTSYDLKGEINNAMVFGRLPAASYTFVVTASDQVTTKQLIETSFNIVGSSGSSSSSASGSHLYDNSNPFYPSYVGQCTWYAYGRAYQILGSKPNLSTRGAQYWFEYNKSNGIYAYGTQPKVNSIVCWRNNSAGHVAVVDKVYSDGTIYISEYWGSSDRKLHQRRINPATYKSSKHGTYSLQGYIYLR